MTDSAPDAPVPKKRSLFKRAAWQDSPKTDGDMFSHASQYNEIVAERTRVQAEERAKAEAAKKQKRAAGPADRKRRKTSSDHDEMAMLNSSPLRAHRANSLMYAQTRTLRLPLRRGTNFHVGAAGHPSLHTLRLRRHRPTSLRAHSRL